MKGEGYVQHLKGMKMLRRLAITMIMATMLFAVNCEARDHGRPPAARVEVYVAQPEPGYVWVNGYWEWGFFGWTWVSGYWAPPPYSGAVYIGGYWGHVGDHYYWHEGHWRGGDRDHGEGWRGGDRDR
jgi:hypothetical protein